MLVFTKKDVISIDQEAVDVFQIPSIELMENASRGSACLINQHLESTQNHQIVVVCGSGNNGGDGFGVARHLKNFGHRIRVVMVQKPMTPDAQANASICEEMNIEIEMWNESSLEGCSAIVDAIFGTGLSRLVEGDAAKAIQSMNDQRVPTFALDIPSGMNCDSGQPLGICIEATNTMTFVGMKIGFLQEHAKPYIGKIEIVDIGCPQSLVEKYGTPAFKYDE